MTGADAIATNAQTDALMEPQNRLDLWLVPPHTAQRRSRSCGGDRKGTVMTRPLVELVEQFCQYQLKQRGRKEACRRLAGVWSSSYCLFATGRESSPGCWI